MLGSSSLAGLPGGAKAGSIAVSQFAASQAKIGTSSLLLSEDQVTAFHVGYWDTPFTALESDVASEGLVLDVRQSVSPKSWLSYLQGIDAAAAVDVAAAFADDTLSETTIADGRVPNLLESWSGGAPAWYDVSERGRVAMHWRCTLRPVLGRSWFSTATTPHFSLAFGGNGYIRVTKTVSGTTTDVLLGGEPGRTVTETDFLTDGLTFTDVMTTVGPNDVIDIYYVQSGQPWGGIVCKVVAGDTKTQALARSAPVLGSGLFDSGTRPTKVNLTSVTSVEVTHDLGAASHAAITLPLINPLAHDGFGYEWRRTSDPNDPGVLVRWDGGVALEKLKRGRLVRVDGGLAGEEFTIFTGVISDFEPTEIGSVVVQCVGFEQRALKTIIKNEPDPVSYMTFAYNRQRGTTEPVYGIAAYDNWAIEYAVQDTLYRVGIDASRFAARLNATDYNGASQPISYNNDNFRKFRARSLLGNLIRVERNSHYGNVGVYFDDALPVDDAYLFSPEDSKEPWSRIRELGDRYGYDIRFDHLGDCILASRGNASTVIDVPTYDLTVDWTSFMYTDVTDAVTAAAQQHISRATVENELRVVGGFDDPTTAGYLATYDAVAQISGYRKIHPSAFKGTYMEWTGTQTPVVRAVFKGSRIDVSLPRGPDLGPWHYMRVVRTSDEFEVARVRDLHGTADDDIFYYDFRTSTDGTNATVLTLYSGPYDEYRVECIGVPSASDGKTRRLDCFFVFAVDPLKPIYPRPLSTAGNALSVSASAGAGDDMRNLVYVVGRRKATVTDSEKFNDNPNNPDPEFIVEVAVDPASITDKTALNYVGARHESLIADSSIGDPDFAAYLARTFVYRYRTPRPPVDIRHTILPVIELRDPLFVLEATYHSVNEMGVLWATRYTHRFSASGHAETTISTSAWPEFPSFDPREDVNVDADFGGVPIANVEASYTSLTNSLKTNLASTGVVHESGVADVVSEIVNIDTGTTPESLDASGLDWPPVPGTIFISPPNGGATSTATITFPPGKTGVTYPNPPGLLGGAPGDVLRSAATGDAMFIPNGWSIDSVQLDTWETNSTNWYLSRSQPITEDRSKQFYYHWDQDARLLTVYWRAGSQVSGQQLFTVFVTYKTTEGAVRGGWLANNPYHHFMNVDYRDSARKVYLPWKQADSTAKYDRPAMDSYTLRYRRLGPTSGGVFADPYGGSSPFADPTTSEIGYLASLRFDALVSGFYRISVRSVYDDTVVAWLTNSTGDPQDSNAHWEFVTAGPQREFLWDYVDQVGVWNQRQSEDYAAMLQGLFETDEKEPIGAGWYVWNHERDNGKLGKLALISGDRDSATGKPIFGQGTFAAWYYRIEVRNDALEQSNLDAQSDTSLTEAQRAKRSFPRLVVTRKPAAPAELSPMFSTNATEAIVYTHLPEPTQLELELADWKEVRSNGVATGAGSSTLDDSGKSWVPNAYVGYTVRTTLGTGRGQERFIVSNTATQLAVTPPWTTVPDGTTSYEVVRLYDPTDAGLATDDTQWTTPDGDATLHTQKPVRMRFLVKDRPGTLWSSKQDRIQVRMTRHVHARILNFDMFCVNTGSYYPGSNVPQRTVYARKLVNDDHTITFPDQGWREARSFKNSTHANGTVQWVFVPSDFKKKFTTVDNEPMQFAQYLQTEEVPSWDLHRPIAGASARLIIAFWGCLFYLSAYIQDRGGRRVWGTNRHFLDQSKIYDNAYGDWWNPVSPTTAATETTYRMEWPDDPLRQQRRTIVCRQWTNEPAWLEQQMTTYQFASESVGNLLLRHKWEDHETSATTLAGKTWPVLDLDYHSKYHATQSPAQLPSPFSNLTRQLGSSSGGSRLGSQWTWESDPLFIPCVTRDFHAYHLIPPMPDPTTSLTTGSSQNIYGQVDLTGYQSATNQGDDAAAGPTWGSWARDMTEVFTSNKLRFAPGTHVDTAQDPNKPPLPANAFDYVRQDSMVHFEDLRGAYSRGSRPAEQPKKITPVRPYFLNPLRYGEITAVPAVRANRQGQDHSSIFRFNAAVQAWFRLSFRSEYLVESATHFPTDLLGHEFLLAMQPEKSRFLNDTARASVTYDSGAWVGWKDDISGGTQLSGSDNIFERLALLFQTGPTLSVTKNAYMHLCLVPQRRSGSL